MLPVEVQIAGVMLQEEQEQEQEQVVVVVVRFNTGWGSRCFFVNMLCENPAGSPVFALNKPSSKETYYRGKRDLLYFALNEPSSNSSSSFTAFAPPSSSSSSRARYLSSSGGACMCIYMDRYGSGSQSCPGISG